MSKEGALNTQSNGKPVAGFDNQNVTTHKKNDGLEKLSFSDIFESKEKKTTNKPSHQSSQKDTQAKTNTQEVKNQSLYDEFFDSMPFNLPTTIHYDCKTECIKHLIADIKKAIASATPTNNIQIQSNFGEGIGQLKIQVCYQKNGSYTVRLKPCSLFIASMGAYFNQLEKKIREKFKIESFEIIAEENKEKLN